MEVTPELEHQINGSAPYNTSSSSHCPDAPPELYYNSFLGTHIAMEGGEAIGTAAYLITIFLMTVVGNILVVISVFTYKPLRQPQTDGIASLAVADLLVAVLVLPWNALQAFQGRWMFSAWWSCRLLMTVDVVCSTASILSLCAIALDRYRAVVGNPAQFMQEQRMAGQSARRTVRRRLRLAAVVWALSLCIGLPPWLGWSDWPDELEAGAQCRLNLQPSYVLYSALGSFYIPLVLMSVLHVRVFIAARRQLRGRGRSSTSNAPRQHPPVQEAVTSETRQDQQCETSFSARTCSRQGDEGGRDPEALRGTPNEPLGMTQRDDIPSTSNTTAATKTPNPVRQPIERRHSGVLLRKERRAFRRTLCVIGFFLICWGPFFILYLFLSFHPTWCPSNRLIDWFVWLGYSNSALNPIIYTIFDPEFRRAFKSQLNRYSPKCFMK